MERAGRKDFQAKKWNGIKSLQSLRKFHRVCHETDAACAKDYFHLKVKKINSCFFFLIYFFSCFPSYFSNADVALFLRDFFLFFVIFHICFFCTFAANIYITRGMTAAMTLQTKHRQSLAKIKKGKKIQIIKISENKKKTLKILNSNMLSLLEMFRSTGIWGRLSPWQNCGMPYKIKYIPPEEN